MTLNDLLQTIPFGFRPRHLNSPDDWGEQDTRLIHLKSVRGDAPWQKQFALYFGCVGGKYYAVTIDWDNRPLEAMEYETLADLKMVWECD